MRSIVIAIALSAVPFCASCGAQDERSKSAREALAAVEELRGIADELQVVGDKVSDMEDKAIHKGMSEGGDPELEALQKRFHELQTRAQKSVANLKPDLDRKIAQEPKDAGLLEARSRFRETLGDVEEAMKDLDAARAILPKDSAIRARRPGLLRRLGKYEEARTACADLLKDEAGHPVGLANDGLCLYSLNAFPEAIARLGEAMAKEGRLEPSLAREVKQTLEAAKAKKIEWDEELKKRADEAKADDLPRVKLVTSKGDIVVELFENEAPNAIASFIDLCEKKFYDGTTFHRVIPNFMAQGGDPNSKDRNPKNDGQGGPGYSFPDEFPEG